MVSTICAIRFRGTYHVMTRQVWRIIMTICGLCVGLAYVALFTVGAYFVGSSGNALTAGYLSAFTGIIIILFASTVPALFENMLDPALLPTLYPAHISPSRKLSLGLLAATAIGPFGLFWFLVSIIPITVMWAVTGSVLTTVIALCGAIVTFALGVVITRLGSALFGQAFYPSKDKGSWKGIFLFIAYFVFCIGLGVAIPLVMSTFGVQSVLRAAHILVYTPLTFAFVWPALAEDAAWVTLLINVIMTLALLFGAWKWWHSLVITCMQRGQAQKLSSEKLNEIEAVAKGDVSSLDSSTETVANAVTVPGKQTAPSKPATLQLQRVLSFIDRGEALGLSPQASAIAARHFRYIAKDVRMTAQILFAPLFLLFGLVFSLVPGGNSSLWQWVAFAGFFAGYSLMNSISLDAKAVWIHVAAPLSGRDDIKGRMVGHMTIPLICLIILGPIVGYLYGQHYAWLLVPVFSVSLFLVSAGISLFGMVRWVTPQAKPGKLTAKGSGAGLSGQLIVRLLLVMFITLLLSVPLGAMTAIAAFNEIPALTLGLSVAMIVYAIVVLTLSYWRAARKLETNYPNLLTTLRTLP